MKYDESSMSDAYRTVCEHHVTGICAPTGSGKSTTLVNYFVKTKGRVVFVVEPTIVAATSLYAFMSRQVQSIGYAVESKPCYQNVMISKIRTPKKPHLTDTQLVYCTGGHMIRIIFDMVKHSKESSDARFCDILILDEGHMHTTEYTLIMLLYRELLNLGIKVPKLVITSATLNIKDLPFNKDPLIEKIGYYEFKSVNYKVDISYEPRSYSIDGRQVLVATAEWVARFHGSNKLSKSETDSILIFCAGSGEISIIRTMLEKSCPDLDIIDIYSNIDDEHSRLKLISPIEKGRRRIILATNIAETSLTIPIRGVVDTMREKYTTSSKTGGLVLQTFLISKTSATQRSGRAGRTQDGFCHRMCSEQDYATYQETRSFSITRIPLHIPILQLLDVGMNIDTVFDPVLTLLTDPFEAILFSERIKKSKSDLFLGGFVTESSLTKLGMFASKFPYFSVNGSRFLYKWLERERYPYMGVVITSLIECHDSGYFNFTCKKISDNYGEAIKSVELDMEEHFNYPGRSDVEVLLNMWYYLITQLNDKFSPARDECYQVCNELRLDCKKIYYLLNTIREAAATCNREFRKNITPVKITPSEIYPACHRLLAEIYAIYTYKRTGENYRNEDGFQCSLSNLRPIMYPQTRAEKIIVLGLFEKVVAKTPYTQATMVIPLDLEFETPKRRFFASQSKEIFALNFGHAVPSSTPFTEYFDMSVFKTKFG